MSRTGAYTGHAPLLVAPTALTLAKAATNFYGLQYGDDAETFALTLMEQELLTSVTVTTKYSTHEQWSLSDAGLVLARQAVPEDVVGNTVTGEKFVSVSAQDRTFISLWFLLILRGKARVGYYGGSNDFGDRLEMLHLTTCGLDRDKSITPTDESWTEFAGTFTEDDRHTGLVGDATCACGKVEALRVEMDYQERGLASLFTTLIDPVSLLP